MKKPEATAQLLEQILCAGTWIYIIETRENFWSDGLFQLIGLDPKTVVPDARLFDSLVHPEDRVELDDLLQRVHSGEPVVMRYRLIRPDGHLLWLESRTEVTFDRKGHPSVLQAVIRDVTASEKARIDTEKLLARAASLTRLAGGDFWRADKHGKILDPSSWARKTGRTTDELTLENRAAAIHPDDRSAYLHAWHTGLREKSVIELTVRVKHEDGIYHPFKSMAFPQFDAKGDLLEWHGMAWSSLKDAPLQTPEQELSIGSHHIRAARAYLGLSAQELATMADVSFSTMRRLETDEKSVRPDNIAKVVKTLETKGIRFEMTGPNEISLRFTAN